MKLAEFIRTTLHTKLRDKCSMTEIEALVNDLADVYRSSSHIALMNSEGEIFITNIQDDILYVHIKSKNDYLFYRKEGPYALFNPYIDVSEVLGENFCLLDKKTVVNKNLIKRYDSYMGIIYFDEDWENEDAVKLYAAITAVERILPKIKGKEYDVRNENESLYAPMFKDKLKLD
ncbi:hypothetical protein [Paenibacillus piri]|uniref:Uncharacterized protein n=1 Tax=Paenibacillus piri TaxID=2547395 RepID=A0A4R5KWB4_9BACL|nr:hypothetical protein [Paenibacillus piri]TDF99425.1 hypothetical protein E1757_06120 [Paenibacillus piri]